MLQYVKGVPNCVENPALCFYPVSVSFRNLSDAQLVSLEFNVLDSLNMKMHRNVSTIATVLFFLQIISIFMWLIPHFFNFFLAIFCP